jgi:TRAP transporter TAXI family solute receptor
MSRSAAHRTAIRRPQDTSTLQEETDMRKFIQALGVAAMVALSAPLAAQDKVNISIATGGTGGVYYPLGGGMAAAFSKYIPGMEATAEVTGGSVDNLKLIGSGKPYIALTMADATLDAYRGEDKFKGNKIPVRTLMILYPNRMHVVSVEGRGINKIADLKGKHVSTGSPGSATEVMAFRVIEAAGLDKDKDMRRERLGVAESVNAMKDNKIDAFFWVGGLPTAAVTDLANTPGTKIRMVDHADLVPAMNKKYGNLYIEDSIPKAAYRGMDTDNKQATVMNILVANANMDDKTAYNIVKTIFDKRADLINVHKEAANFKLENQKASASPIPFHPGAVKYFAEHGIKLN